MDQFDPPPPPVSHPGVEATDITRRFASAVRSLAPGEIIKDEFFTLFESVSALEIMDPKMDSGVLAEGESLDEEYDVLRPLLPEEILGIIDQLLCLEMAWHLGYPLSQTLLTSVYIEALMNPCPRSIADVDFTRAPEGRTKQPTLLFILRAYCLGLLKACHLVNELVKEELYYEEEDFVTNTYDRSLLSEIEAAPITSLLQRARSDLRSTTIDVPKEISMALDLRLELRIAFLRAIDLSTLRQANPDSLKMPWIQMQGLMDHISKQQSLGTPVPAAFSTKLQRHLTSTMPPRPIVELSFDECTGHFKRLFQDGVEVTDVLKYCEPQSLLTFVSTFQAKKPQPLVFIRTLLQSMLWKEMVFLGNHSIRQVIDQDLSIVVLPAAPQLDPAHDKIEVPSDYRHQLASQMETFRQRAAEAYLDIFRIFCQNRCRIRRTLFHNIREWEALQQDAEDLDQSIHEILRENPLVTERGNIGHALPLSSWAYLYKLRQMEWIVQLGFELDIYQTDELAGMYFYLSVLGKARAQHCDRIKTFVTARADDAARKARKPRDVEYGRSLQYLRNTMLEAACTWEFADGLCCLYTALRRLNLLPAPPRPYSTDALRYEIRMRPFSYVALPALPTYDEFALSSTQPDTPTGELLRIAESAVGGARKGFEAFAKMPEQAAFAMHAHERWVSNVRNCLRASIAAQVAVSTTLRAHARAGGDRAVAGDDGRKELDGTRDLKLRVDWGKEKGKAYHDWWVVPKVVALAP